MIDVKKTELRKQLAREISELSDDYITASDIGLFRNTISLKEFSAARNIMIYYSVKREPATVEIAKAALQMGKTVAFPICYREGIMQARMIHSLDQLRPAMLGIPAPPETAPVITSDKLDMIIVPALTYDCGGYRIGYGGGYYDRYLSGTQAFTLGLARERLIKAELPSQNHDIAVKCIVTEERVFCPTLLKK